MRKKIVSALSAFVCAAALCHAAEVRLDELPADTRAERIRGDMKTASLCRSGLQGVLSFVRSQPRLFPPQKPAELRLLDVTERQMALSVWMTVLDYTCALDSVGRVHRDFYRLKDAPEREDSFLVTYAAFLAEYRFALDLLAAFETQPALEALWNEPAPDQGLAKGTYAQYRFRFLNVARATEYAALSVTHKALGGQRHPDLRASIAADSDAILQMGKFKGQAMTARNALRVIEEGAFAAWFPAQTRVAEWMGDTKVKRVNECLISGGQTAALPKRLEPGDILLVRREWFLSNVGLPGFWPHAALYVGTPGERQRFFSDAAVAAWLAARKNPAKDFEACLAAEAKSYPLSVKPQEQGHAPRVIEAISEGVSCTTIEHSADADSVAVLRPRLTKVEKAEAVLRAFQLVGRPYDFNFDFQTDSALVCTEVVYKAYEPRPGYRGLVLDLVNVMGRMVLPANEIARQFAAAHDSPARQFDLVLFLDGYEREKVAVEADAKVFLESWKRPKWHVLTQDAAPKR